MSGLEGQLELPWLPQAAQGPVTLEKDVLGPDQLSPHIRGLKMLPTWHTPSIPRCH